MNELEQDDLFEGILPSDQQEDESDFEQPISFQETVVQTADWTVGTLFAQLNKGTIDLDPGFQRRQAWDTIRKSRLIESLIVGLPIPNIVLAENVQHRGRFLVIDGKQRLLTIKNYLDNELPLKGIDLRRDLDGCTFENLPQPDRDFLENNSIRATVIKNIADQNFLYVMFFRLNSGSLPLSPQELRKALIGGKALNKIDHYIENSEIFRKIFGPALDRRMRDSELVLRFIAFDRGYENYKGDLKAFLDESVKHFETIGDEIDAELDAGFLRLDSALNATVAIFGKDAFRKWTGDRYERRINRAIFDVIIRFFAEPKIVAAAQGKSDAITTAFKEVCTDAPFRSAVEKTTKSIEATKTRTNKWGQKLAAILRMTYAENQARIE